MKNMRMHFVNVIVIWTLLSLLSRQICQAQQTNIVLDQGALVGLKVFPDSSRTAVYAFLGLPFAQPPIGELRFAPPKPHTGWNWTLQAMNMKPICPQLTNSIYDETPEGNLARPALMDEDCLYLNIWVPEAGMRLGNLPVLVIITGELMAFDWPRNRPIGLDFASEGVIVVTVQYRSNIFGWISLGNRELPGNYGLQDQQLALQWIQHNIQHFGGNPRQVTLLGHGTSGVPCVLAHLLSIAVPGQALFSKAILMSGGDALNILQSNETVIAASRLMVQKLGCQFEGPGGQVDTCLRSKSVSDLQMAFESIYDHGNGTMQLGPVLKRDPLLVLTNATWLQRRPPLIIGICSNEGAFLEDYWLDLAREGPSAISDYVNYTVLPQVLRRLTQRNGGLSSQLMNALRWKYFEDGEVVSVSHRLHAIQRLISEFQYEMPFYEALEHLIAANVSDTSFIYAYVFKVTNSMDLRGKINLFDGASHASDLPLLLGPSLFQQIARRRFTAEEDKLCRKLRAAFANFIKSSNPTPGRIFDSWLAYTKQQKFIYSLGESVSEFNEITHGAAFMKNQPQIDKLLDQDKSNAIGLSRPNRNEFRNPYQIAAIAPPLATNDARRTKSADYYSKIQQDSSYALHLKHVYGFWQLMLPNDAAYGADGSLNDALSQRMRLMEASADAQRYKQGFFAMLSLVCVLLAVLGLCVYLLRRDPLRLTSHTSNFRL